MAEVVPVFVAAEPRSPTTPDLGGDRGVIGGGGGGDSIRGGTGRLHTSPVERKPPRRIDHSTHYNLVLNIVLVAFFSSYI